MLFTLYILFILVMTHALEALPFGGSGYYGHTFHKNANKGNANKKFVKPIYSLMNPFLLKNRISQKLPFKGFQSANPLFYPSFIGRPLFDNMKSNIHHSDHSFLIAPYTFYKSSFSPIQNIPKQQVQGDLKSSKRIPKIYELSFESFTPNKLLFGDINSISHVQSKVKLVKSSNNPKLDSANILTIDFVKENKDLPANIIESEFDTNGVFSVPSTDIATKGAAVNDAPVELTIIEFGKPNNKDKSFNDKIVHGNTIDVRDIPILETNSVPGVSKVDVSREITSEISAKGMINSEIGKKTNASFENLISGNIGTVGDIPGFIFDGGIASDLNTEPIYLTNEMHRDLQGVDVIDVNNVMLKEGDLTTDSNLKSIVDPEISVKIVTPREEGNSFDGNTMKELQQIGVGINDISVHNDISINIKPTGNAAGNIFDIANISGEHIQVKEGEKNEGSGSVVVMRPVSFHMKVEPFGPGPYGQCREPSRVICGARFGWEHVTGMVSWCKLNCVVYMYSSYCDDDRCQCKCV